MHLDLRQSFRLLAQCFLITAFVLPSSLLAQSHVVSQADIHKELINAKQTRQKNLQKVERLMASDEALKALESARVKPEQVNAAISTLSDVELARLADRADKLDQDFAAGRLSDRDLLFVVLGIVALVLIIVAVR